MKPHIAVLLLLAVCLGACTSPAVQPAVTSTPPPGITGEAQNQPLSVSGGRFDRESLAGSELSKPWFPRFPRCRTSIRQSFSHTGLSEIRSGIQ